MGSQRSLLSRYYSFRDKLLASPVFKHWAARFPLTRPLARKRARQLFDLCAGFVYSQTLYACVQLNLFQFLRDGPRTLPEIARHCGLDEDAAGRLLDAAVALELLRREQGSYGLGIHGAALVGDDGIIEMIKHHAMLYQDLGDPVALLKGDIKDKQLEAYWNYTDEQQVTDTEINKVSAYTELMSASQSLVAEQVLNAYSLEGKTCLLDVGGGDGTFLTHVAQRYTSMKLMHFDLPAVADRARNKFQQTGLAERIMVHGGSFLHDDLPKGADIISLVRIIHDHDDAAAMKILQAVRKALPQGGTLLIAEPMSGVAGTEAMADAYFGFYLLAMGRGRPRTAARLKEMLGEAGFTKFHQVPTPIPLQTSLLATS